MAGILILEEDEAVRVLAQSVLQEHSHETFSANTIDQAAALLGSGKNKISICCSLETEFQGEIQCGWSSRERPSSDVPNLLCSTHQQAS
jgi:DNA-binding NtrC family response regulator